MTCAGCGRRGAIRFSFSRHIRFMSSVGRSAAERLRENIDCFDAIEVCHFHKGWFDPNRFARKAAAKFGKPLLATSDAHQLTAFGGHYTSIPRPSVLTPENVFAALRSGVGRAHESARLHGGYREHVFFHVRGAPMAKLDENAALESRS